MARVVRATSKALKVVRAIYSERSNFINFELLSYRAQIAADVLFKFFSSALFFVIPVVKIKIIKEKNFIYH